MRKSMFAFGLAMLGAGLAAGGAIGYLSGSAGSADLARTPSPAAAPVVARDGAAPVPVPAGRQTGADRDSGAAPAANAAAPSAESGTGAITGSVVEPDGAPLAGVLVRAEPSEEKPETSGEAAAPRLPPGSPPPRKDVAREVQEFEKRLVREQAGLREAVTDSSGAYALSGLTAKSYALEAWLVGYRIVQVGGNLWAPITVGSRCDFKAVPLRSVSVSVLLPDGTAPGKAAIEWKPAGGGDEGSADWSPADPGIEVEPGTYEFTARAVPSGESPPMGRWSHGSFLFASARSGNAEDDSLYRSDPQTVTIGSGESQALAFRLEGRPGILVKVVYGSSEHPRTVRIAALRIDGGASADPSRLLGEGRVKARWLDGTAEGAIAGLDPGTYLVGATFRGGQIGPTATVAVGAGLVTQELRVPDAGPRDWVTVWVRAPDGTPIRDATIECGCRGSEGNGEQKLDIKAEADGSYRVEHYEKDAPSFSSSWSFGGNDLGPGARAYFVRATSERYGTEEATYDPVKDLEVIVQLIAPAILRATIPGYAASPDRGRAILTLEAKDEGGGGRGSDQDAQIDAAGTAKFPPVKPGRYEVVLRLARSEGRNELQSARWNGAEVARIPLTLAPGETSVTVPLQTLADLTVTFEGDAPDLKRVGADGVPRHLRGNRGEGGEHESVFKDLAAGRYLLADRAGEMWVDVPASGPIAFRPNPFNAYFLEVTDKGYVRDLGLKTGDLVVAIDGVEFKDKKGMDAALAGAMTRESAKITIQRDGVRFDVTADPRKFEGDDGSFYQPLAR
jgi:hypothetical protein